MRPFSKGSKNQRRTPSIKTKALKPDIQNREREAIILEKEEAAKRHAGLELTRGRREEATRQSILGLEEKITAMSQQLSLTKGDPSTAADIRELYARRDEAVQQQQQLEDKVRRGAYLSPEEERAMEELEDRLEALDAEIEYKGQVSLNRFRV